jgi:hypothetical protein
MSLEMAHRVIVPPKKIISRSFLNSGTLIVIIGIYFNPLPPYGSLKKTRASPVVQRERKRGMRGGGGQGADLDDS